MRLMCLWMGLCWGLVASAWGASAVIGPVAAAYRVEFRLGQQWRKPQTWYFIRETQRISVIKPGIEEIWHRSDAGQLSFDRIFHADKRIVEYTPGELRTLMVVPKWAELGALFDPDKLGQLQARPGPAGADWARYSGKLGAEHIELEWLPAQTLPRKLVRSMKGRAVRFTLLAQHARAPADWPCPEQGSADYQRTDAADFGDMQADPFIHKASRMDVQIGWRHPHDHE